MQTVLDGRYAADRSVVALGMFDGVHIGLIREPEGDDPPVQPAHGAHGVDVVVIGDDDALLFRHEGGKLPERGDNIVGIAEKVQMIAVDVEDDGDGRAKAQKAVFVFARLGDEEIPPADAQRTAPDRG